MLELLRSMGHDLVEWHKQIVQLAAIAVRKQTQNTFLGWLWLLIKPAMYIFCFWFAIFVGIRGARDGMNSIQYLIWLSAGIMPWFFLQETINGGSKVFSKYKYLVNKLKFPVALIPVFYELSAMFIHFLLLAVLFIMYFLAGGTVDIYFVQIPMLVVIMYLFSIGWSLMTSSLSALSKDFENVIKTLSTPIFWLSGVIFDVSHIDIPIVHWVLMFNPVTFIVQSYRTVFSNGSVVSGGGGWIWNDPVFFGCGMGVIVLTIIVGLFIFSRLHKDIPDVL